MRINNVGISFKSSEFLKFEDKDPNTKIVYSDYIFPRSAVVIKTTYDNDLGKPKGSVLDCVVSAYGIELCHSKERGDVLAKNLGIENIKPAGICGVDNTCSF